MEILDGRIHYFKEKQTSKIIKENAKLNKELEELNVSVWEARHIYNQTRKYWCNFMVGWKLKF